MHQIEILLATHNGATFLSEQIDSILKQSHSDWKLIIHDDASTDGTINIIKKYTTRYPNKIIFLDDAMSFSSATKNFSFLLQKVKAKYIMLSDQDDIWKPDKIEKTFQKMKELESKWIDKPLLVHTDLELVDEKLNPLSSSMWQHNQLNPYLHTFNRLLVQNTITGCTLMINKKLAVLASPIPESAKMHDYWLGLVAEYFGKIGTLPEQTILYRQHSSNTIGSQGFSRAYFQDKLFKKDILSQNIMQAKKFLKLYKANLDEETIQMLKDFSNIESKSFWKKRKILVQHKFFKQGLMRNIGLLVKI